MTNTNEEQNMENDEYNINEQQENIQNGVDYSAYEQGTEEKIDDGNEDSDGDGELKDSDGEDKKEDGALDSSDGELKDDEDCEDGEIKEPGLKKPFLRPMCRFFSRGNCSWGTNCRFLHPGVNDKGNYSMIDQQGQAKNRTSATPWLQEIKESLPAPPPLENQPETAWERGLRHLKEMKKRQKEPGDVDIKEEQISGEQPMMKPPIVPPALIPRDPYYDEPFRPPPIHPSFEAYPGYPPMGMPPHMLPPPPSDPWMYRRPPFDYGWMKPGYPPHPEFYPPPGYQMPYSDQNIMMKSGGLSPPIRMEHVDKFGRTVQGLPTGYDIGTVGIDPWSRGKSQEKKSDSKSRSGSRGRHLRSGSYSSFSSSSNSSKSRSGSKSSFSSSSGSSSSRTRASSRSPNRERKVPKKPQNFNKTNSSKNKINLPPIPGQNVAETGPIFDEKVSIPIAQPKPTIISVGKPNQLGSLAQSVVDAFKEGDDLDIFGRSNRGLQPLPTVKSSNAPLPVDFNKPPPAFSAQFASANSASAVLSKIYKPPQITSADLMKINGELLAKRARSRSSSTSSSSSSSTSGGSDHLYDNIASPISSESSLSDDSEPSVSPQQPFKYTVHDKRATEFQPRGMRPYYRGPYDPTMRGGYRPFHRMMGPDMQYRYPPIHYRFMRPMYEPRMRREYMGPPKPEVDEEEDEGDKERMMERRKYTPPLYDRPPQREENFRPDYRNQEQYDHSNIQHQEHHYHPSTYRGGSGGGGGGHSRSMYYKESQMMRRQEDDHLPPPQTASYRGSTSHHHHHRGAEGSHHKTSHRSRQMAAGDHHHRGSHNRSFNRSMERYHHKSSHERQQSKVVDSRYRSGERRRRSSELLSASPLQEQVIDRRIHYEQKPSRKVEPLPSRKRSPESSISPDQSPPHKHSRMTSDSRTSVKSGDHQKHSDSYKHYERKREPDRQMEQRSPSPPSPHQPTPPPMAEHPKKKKGTASRREELLLQLKAVEDAIAKKKKVPTATLR